MWGIVSSNVSKIIASLVLILSIGLYLNIKTYNANLQKTFVDESSLPPVATSTPKPSTIVNVETAIEEKQISVSPVATVKPLANCFQVYSSASFWNTKINSTVSYHPESDKFIARLKGVFGSDPNQYTYPVYKVNSETPAVKVSYSGVFSEVLADGKLKRDSGGGEVNIPIPSDARQSTGDDAQIIVVNTQTGEEWGLYEARRDSAGNWQAKNGYKYNINWSGVTPSGFGSRGAGVTYLSGLIRKCEIDRGYIGHAIAFGYDYPSPRFVYPATKSDGRGSETMDLPEGARLQLNPNASENEITSWCTGSGINTRSCKLVVRALQEYGMVVVDGSGHPKIYAEDNLTANWGDTWSSKIPSKIPFSAFKVVDFK